MKIIDQKSINIISKPNCRRDIPMHPEVSKITREVEAIEFCDR